MAKGSSSSGKAKQSSSSLASSQSSSRLLTAYSSSDDSALFFAQAQLAVDADTVRIFDCKSGGHCSARWSTSNAEAGAQARVTVIAWASLPLAFSSNDEKATRGKKRRKSSTSGNSEQVDAAASTSTASSSAAKSQPALCIGLSNGSIIVLHPKQSSVIATLSHPASSTSSIQSLCYSAHHKQPSANTTLWSCSANGQILAWQLPKVDGCEGRLLAAYEGCGAEWAKMAVCYTQEKALLVVARHAIKLLEADLPVPSSSSRELQTPTISVKSSYTGHASEVTQLLWLGQAKEGKSEVNGHTGTELPTQFASCAEGDRSLNVWSVHLDSAEGLLRGTVPLDSNIRCISASQSAERICAVLTSGSASIVAAEAQVAQTPQAGEKKKRRKSAVPTLDIQCSITGPSDGSGVTNVHFERDGQAVHIARNPVKPVFQSARIVDEAGSDIASIDLSAGGKVKGLLSQDTSSQNPTASRTVYSEPVQSAVLSGDVAVPEAKASQAGDASAAVLEPTLAQRLKSLQVRQSEPDTNEAETSLAGRRPGQGAKAGRLRIADVTSLSQSLVQALHSSDAKLLESCLEKTNPKMLRNTIRRVPNTLVLPLVEALVERLGRSKQGFGAGTGGVNAARGHALVEWLRHVLTVHLAYLITVPSLVSRLASLYATMETRIAHHNQLLALNGRLDLVVSQIDLTADQVPSQHLLSTKAQKSESVAVAKPAAARKYVEGESSSSDSEDEETGNATVDQQAQAEPAEENGVVEDLVMQEDGSLNGDVDDSDDDEEDEEEDMPALRKSQVSKLNGFLELEAEESDEEGSEEEGRLKKDKPAFSLVNGHLGEGDEEEDEEDLDRYESDFINDDDSDEESDGNSE